jgi:EAL domain-containing protein (putative c-di-GMP-specific phosphodiesterase class I)
MGLAVATLTHSLGVVVVAEGVESSGASALPGA